MTALNIHEAKTQFSSVISTVEKTGEAVIICKYGKAVAKIVPFSQHSRTQTSDRLKNVEFLSDPTLGTEDEWDDA